MLGPSAGDEEPRRRTRLRISNQGRVVGELWADGELDDALLARVAELISAHVLLGWAPAARPGSPSLITSSGRRLQPCSERPSRTFNGMVYDRLGEVRRYCVESAHKTLDTLDLLATCSEQLRDCLDLIALVGAEGREVFREEDASYVVNVPLADHLGE